MSGKPSRNKGKPLYKFSIPGKLAGLNEFVQSNRNSKYGGNKAKREAEATITSFLPRAVRRDIAYPVWFEIDWYEPSNRRDADNVMFGKKFICDAVVRAGLLTNDSRKFIAGFTERVLTDKVSPRIEVTIWELGT